MLAIGLFRVYLTSYEREETVAIKPLVLLQHEEENPPGEIGAALERVSMPFEVRRLDRGDALPVWPDEACGIISIGGARTLEQLRELPHYAEEKQLMQTIVRQGGPLWGVCLGAQLLTLACGGQVWRSQRAPVGWVRVQKVLEDPLLERVSSPFPAFSWRKLACSEPLTARRVASSDETPWVFRVGGRAWGIQFHPEITAELAERWLADILEEEGDAGDEFVAQLTVDTEQYLPINARFCQTLTENFVYASGLLPRP